MSNLQEAEPPGGGRRHASVERSLAQAREAHQKALAMAAALEEEIEQLSCPLIRSQSEVRAHSRSRIDVDADPGDKRGGTTRCGLRIAMLPTLSTTLPKGVQSLKEMQQPLRISIWRELPELGPKVTSFLQGSAESLGEETMKVPSPKPPIEELQKWVTWKAQAYETPSWWQELTVVPVVSTNQSEPPLPTSKMEVIWQAMPTPGFIGVTACLQRDQSLEGVCEVPQTH